MRDITAIAMIELKSSFDSRQMELFLNLTKELLDAIHSVHDKAVARAIDAANPHRPDFLKLSQFALQLIFALEQLKKCVIRPDIRFGDNWSNSSKSFDIFFVQYVHMRMFLR